MLLDFHSASYRSQNYLPVVCQFFITEHDDDDDDDGGDYGNTSRHHHFNHCHWQLYEAQQSSL